MKVERNEVFSGAVGQNDILVSGDGFVVTDASWHQEALPSPFSRLYYVMDGSGMLVSNEMEMRLEPGFVYLAPCGTPCGFYGTDSVTKLFFHINVILSDGYDLFASCRRFAKLERSPAYIERLKSHYFSGDSIRHIMLKGELWSTVASFADMLLPSGERQGGYSEPVANAIAYIRDHLSASLTVSEVSGAAFCSTVTLGAAFRREMGTTVAQYIEDLLLFEARRMLLSSECTIGEISATLGYCDQFYFSRRFRNRFSISPKDYRRQRAQT